MAKTSDMGQEPPFIQSINEPEIDWIMAVELNGNAVFRDWLGRQIFGFSPIHNGAWKSVFEYSGESDLVWCVADSNGQYHMALIENKINAPEQQDQHARYQQRGNEYVEKGYAVDFCTVLIELLANVVF